jgi:hypothetical protein
MAHGFGHPVVTSSSIKKFAVHVAFGCVRIQCAASAMISTCNRPDSAVHAPIVATRCCSRAHCRLQLQSGLRRTRQLKTGAYRCHTTHSAHVL